MIRAAVSILLLIYSLGSTTKQGDRPTIFIDLNDSLKVEIIPNYDSLGLLNSYQTNIATPVCEEDKCYAIEIVFHWDMIGRFLRYDTIPGKGLTKLDHKAFTSEDYTELYKILSDSESLLGFYTHKELVLHTRKSEIDGLTGATIPEIKQSVISGAVYSCHSLWHIAHGAVVEKLQKYSISNFSVEQVEKLVKQQDQEVNHFLIHAFSDQDFRLYFDEVSQMIRQGEGYFAKNAIERIPEGLLQDSLVQVFFTEQFDQLNYFAQVALLEKLDGNSLNAKMNETLQNSITKRNSYKNELIKKLVGFDKD